MSNANTAAHPATDSRVLAIRGRHGRTIICVSRAAAGEVAAELTAKGVRCSTWGINVELG